MLKETGPNCERIVSSGDRQMVLVTGAMERLNDRFGALVSPDDNYLSHGGGVSSRIWAVGKLEGCFSGIERPHLRLGDVFPSSAGNLNADHVLHAITIDLDTGQRIASANPSALIRAVFATAEGLGCDSVALPLLGTGAARLDPDAFVQAFTAAVRAWAQGPSSLDTVALVILPSQAKSIRIQLEQASKSIEWAEHVISKLPASFRELAQTWMQHGSLALKDRSVSVLVLEDLCRQLALFEGLVSAEQADSATGRAVIDCLAKVLDESTRSALIDAWLIRNQAAHSRVLAGTDVTDRTNEVILRLFKYAANRKGGRRSQEGISRTQQLNKWHPKDPRAAEDLKLEQPRSLNSQEVPSNAGTVAPSADGMTLREDSEQSSWSVPGVSTTPLRELRTFVDHQLTGKYRQEFLKRLDDDGYDGPEELKILEFLIREPELDRWIANEFPRSVLQKALHARSVKTNAVDCEVLARKLLKSFRFPCPRKFKGIERIKLELNNIENELLIAQSDFDGCVARASKLLEYASKVLIRFLTQAAFQEPPDVFLTRTGKLKAGAEFANCTLGALLDFVACLANEIDNDSSTASVRQFKSVLGQANPLPKDMGELAGVRNSFLHYKELSSSLSETERRKSARRFVKNAIQFVNSVHSEGAGLFPVIIRIDSITIDRWGRRTIAAFREDERRETIFTDQPLEPGHVYFMHPLSNPLRVDPILVLAGDLWMEG